METKSFNLDRLVDNWESVNLNPIVIIYRDRNCYILSVIHINETSKQASPATYEIQEDKDAYFINYNLKRTTISHDTKLERLTLSALGDYMRN